MYELSFTLYELYELYNYVKSICYERNNVYIVGLSNQNVALNFSWMFTTNYILYFVIPLLRVGLTESIPLEGETKKEKN